METAINPQDYYEITPDIFWVGHYLEDDHFQCHVYLIKNGDNSVLIDPGSKLTFHHVLRKIEKIVPFTSIKWFICHHQDPDITGALQLIDQLISRDDAVIVSHWRAIALLKHYGLKMGFMCVEEHGWQLDIGDRILQFIFSPYLHFPGAFCTFDKKTGILFSSDIFGGFTDRFKLFATDESYLESIRPFHEHYMPAKEILYHFLTKLDAYDISLIAPQHGSIIPKHLIDYIIKELKILECGLFILTQTSTEVMRLSNLNNILQSFLKNIVARKQFSDIADDLINQVRNILPVISLSFYAMNEKERTLYLAQENLYHGVEVDMPELCNKYFDLNKNQWEAKIKKPFDVVESSSDSVRIILPLYSSETEKIHALAIFVFSENTHLDSETVQVLQQMSIPLSVAVEREIVLRTMDLERQKFYEQAIRDPLTNLYTRIYMNEAITRLMHIHDRDEDASLSVIMLDIDLFKSVNDAYGHNFGDEVLKTVAQTIVAATRAGDIQVRFGGEEFIVFLVTPIHEIAKELAERMRSGVEALKWEAPMENRTVTISLGVVKRKQGEGLADLLHRADMALYSAKQNGRNRVENG